MKKPSNYTLRILAFFAIFFSYFCGQSFKIDTQFITNHIISTDSVKDYHVADVFVPGDYDSKYYRIPAVTLTPDKKLIAVADKRIETMRDLPGKIDVVARISSDGGKTWGEYITVAEHDSVGGFGDPAIVTDRQTGDIIVISSHGSGLWGKAPARIIISRSHDNGKTWDNPYDIGNQIYNFDGAPLQNIEGAFASSGNALQTKSGRLMFVLVTREKDIKPIKFKCYAIYSDDGGINWKVSKVPGTYDGDESKVAQLSDGSLIMSIRNRYQGKRKFSRSYDEGVTWTNDSLAEDIDDPACNGDLITVSDKDGNEWLLLSLPGSSDSREKVSIYASNDGGNTWPVKYQVLPSGSAYSSLVQLPDGSIGMLVEENPSVPTPELQGSYLLRFYNIPLDRIIP